MVVSIPSRAIGTPLSQISTRVEPEVKRPAVTQVIEPLPHLVLAPEGDGEAYRAMEAILGAERHRPSDERDLGIDPSDLKSPGNERGHLLSGHRVERAVEPGPAPGGDPDRGNGADVLGVGASPDVGEVVLSRGQFERPGQEGGHLLPAHDLAQGSRRWGRSRW